jgi:hypothetical protein
MPGFAAVLFLQAAATRSVKDCGGSLVSFVLALLGVLPILSQLFVLLAIEFANALEALRLGRRVAVLRGAPFAPLRLRIAAVVVALEPFKLWLRRRYRTLPTPDGDVLADGRLLRWARAWMMRFQRANSTWP